MATIPFQRSSVPRPTSSNGFTLIEVVLALAIFAFAAVGLISLFSLGLNTSRDSTQKMLSSNIATSLLATRRAAPSGTINGFLLPPLNASTNNENTPIFLTEDGFEASTTDQARLGLIYRIVAPDPALTTPGFSKVYLCFFWPATAAPSKALGRFEITTSVSLP